MDVIAVTPDAAVNGTIPTAAVNDAIPTGAVITKHLPAAMHHQAATFPTAAVTTTANIKNTLS